MITCSSPTDPPVCLQPQANSWLMPSGVLGTTLLRFFARHWVQQQHTMHFTFVNIGTNEKHALAPPVAGY